MPVSATISTTTPTLPQMKAIFWWRGERRRQASASGSDSLLLRSWPRGVRPPARSQAPGTGVRRDCTVDDANAPW